MSTFSQSAISNTYPAPISEWIKYTMVIAFALLWAIWIQPHTIVLRHALLTIGSLLGLYVISRNLPLFKTRRALPVYLIGLLFAWITFHLFFLSHQYELQLAEYSTIWKRIAWGVPFAIGLGIVLGQLNAKSKTEKGDGVNTNSKIWWIFYIGIAAPTFIYLMRAGSMFLAGKFGWQLPVLAMNHPDTSTWHITKMGIIFFCLPALAIACSQCICLAIKKTQYSVLFFSIFIGSISAVLVVFYLENAKNGMIYSVILILVTLIKIAIAKKLQWSWRDGIISVAMVTVMATLLVWHVENNRTWKTFFADIKVAKNLDQSDAWKDYGARGYPLNEMGVAVAETNYVRAAWAQVALGFIAERPMGYGLIDGSFGKIAFEKWPDSTLFHAHSAWLDLTLGIGIPGTFLLLLPAILGLVNAQMNTPQFWGVIALWMLLSIALLMVTTEVSRPPFMDALVFLILWVAGLGLSREPKP